VAAASTTADAVIRGFRPSKRLIEVVVAVAAAAVAAGIVTSWVGQMHQERPDAPNPLHLIECKYNLQKIYTSGLRPYCDVHSGHFPSVANATDRPERNIAGLVYPILYQDKLLSPYVSVRCPGAVGLGVSPYGLEEIKRMQKEPFECWANHLHHSYAYSLGYRSKGQAIGLRLEEGKPSSLMPLMADSAPLDAKVGNSPHHGSHGQNVLYCDGHVVFSTTRNAGYEQDDIYLNRAGKVAAGLDWTDTVLSSSLAPP
jgi:prepilin-type processing-associated H-X9-DG protein